MKKKYFSQLFAEFVVPPIEIKAPSTYKGKAAIYFSKEEMAKVASPFKFAAIGKFLDDRPKIDEIQKFFAFLNLKGEMNVRNLDHYHVLIRCVSEADFLRN